MLVREPSGQSLVLVTELIDLFARHDQVRRPGAVPNRSRPHFDVGAPPQPLCAPIAYRRWEDDVFDEFVGPIGRDVEDLGDLSDIYQRLHGASYPAVDARWNDRVDPTTSFRMFPSRVGAQGAGD